MGRTDGRRDGHTEGLRKGLRQGWDAVRGMHEERNGDTRNNTDGQTDGRTDGGKERCTSQGMEGQSKIWTHGQRGSRRQECRNGGVETGRKVRMDRGVGINGRPDETVFSF